MKHLTSYLVFDFETSGLDRQRERIIQVGLCSVIDDRVDSTDGWLVNQGVDIDPEAWERHRITKQDTIVRGISPSDSLSRLLGVMQRATVCIGHNIHGFDVPFLRAECARLGASMPACENWIDTAALYKGWMMGWRKDTTESHAAYASRVLETRAPGLKYSIPACLDELQLRVDKSRLHDASADAYATHLIFQALRERL